MWASSRRDSNWFCRRILLTESLDVRFSERIEEFLTALLPCRLEFGRCDVPVRPASHLSESYDKKSGVPWDSPFLRLGHLHIVRTTRNCALPLIIRA